MEYRRFDHTIFVRMDRGEELLTQLRQLAELEHIRLASVQALGSITQITSPAVLRSSPSPAPSTQWTAHTMPTCT